MEEKKRLPAAEFSVMKVVWEETSPVTATMVRDKVERGKQWKVQTVVSLLQRLVERGFLRTDKVGRDRLYYPVMDKEAYLRMETDYFVQQYHDNSLLNLVNALYDGNSLHDEEIEALLAWAKERRG